MKERKNVFIRFNSLQELFINNELGLSVKKLNTILNLIIIHYLYNKYYEELVPISSKRFHKIDHNYRRYIDFLKDNKIIYVNEYFSKDNGITKRYGFSEEFKSVKHDISVLFNNYKNKNSDVNIVNKSLKMYLSRMYQQIKIIQDPELEFIKYYSYHDNNKSEKIVGDFKRYIRNKINIDRIKQKESKYRWNNNRLYTSFGMCSSKVRKECFSLDGNKLRSIDIKNSYPFFLTLWLKKNYYKNDGSKLDNEINTFINDILNGDFYLKMIKHYFSVYQKDNVTKIYNKLTRTYIEKISREEMKQIIMRIINSDRLSNKDGEPVRDKLIYPFFLRYPYIFNIIKNIKMYFILEEMESDFIFNKVINRLKNEIKGIRVITCHDEIYFPEQYYDEVKRIWDDEYEKIKNNIIL